MTTTQNSKDCPECGERLRVETDAEHYRRTAEYRYHIVCDDCCTSRPATPEDDDLIEDASERYWTAKWAGDLR